MQPLALEYGFTARHLSSARPQILHGGSDSEQRTQEGIAKELGIRTRLQLRAAVESALLHCDAP